jgi:hypothetical protein
MEHLGHTKIATTIDTYGHLFQSVRLRLRVALEETWDEGLADAARHAARVISVANPGVRPGNERSPLSSGAAQRAGVRVGRKGFEPLTPCASCDR